MTAFEVLYDRHHRALLSFCRHMLGSAEDGEDALQQTFLRAHGALRGGQVPDAIRRHGCIAIARNRCLSMLSARRAVAVPLEDVEPSFDGLAEDVELRNDLRQLVADLGRLPEEQRAALVLFELGGMSQSEIGESLGVPASKVKALVFQARAELMAERDARSTPCASIQEELSVARGGALRRGPLRRHLKHCEPCQAYRSAVMTQRAGLASIMPVAPAFGLKAAVLAAAAGKTALSAAGAGGAAGGVLGGGAAPAGSASSAARAARRRCRGRRGGQRRCPRRKWRGRRCRERCGRERCGRERWCSRRRGASSGASAAARRRPAAQRPPAGSGHRRCGRRRRCGGAGASGAAGAGGVLGGGAWGAGGGASAGAGGGAFGAGGVGGALGAGGGAVSGVGGAVGAGTAIGASGGAAAGTGGGILGSTWWPRSWSAPRWPAASGSAP